MVAQMVDKMDLLSVDGMVAPMAVMKVDLLVDLRADQMVC